MEVVGLLSGFFIQEHLIKNMKDFYKILGIKKGSKIFDIKKAFRELTSGRPRPVGIEVPQNI